MISGSEGTQMDVSDTKLILEIYRIISGIGSFREEQSIDQFKVQLIAQKDEFLPGMKLAMERAMLTSNSPRVKEIDERLEALQKELLKKANAKQGFEELADEIDSLREEKQDLLVEEANRAGMKQRLDELEAFLTEQTTEVTECDEGLVRQLIEKITVYDDHLAFEFKSGLETEVQM